MKENVCVPDVGDATEIEVIEILVTDGATVDKDQSLVVLESDKASMEIPSPHAGQIDSIAVELGDKVDEGDLIVVLNLDQALENSASAQTVDNVDPVEEEGSEQPEPEQQILTQPTTAPESGPGDLSERETTTGSVVHAGPGVRKQAREMGVDLNEVNPTGQHNRVLKEDLISHVRARMQPPETESSIPAVDHAKFGSVEVLAMSRVRRASARNLHQSWVTIPHVTHFEEADISGLEEFRRAQNLRAGKIAEREANGSPVVKFTLLPFLVSCVASTLKMYPKFNSSLHADGEHLVYKDYINIGIAVETDDGLMVPVLRDADKKGLVELSRSCAELARQARAKTLPIDASLGGTFTISSLGGIGGTGFTPIINAPQVAILGVSRAFTKPVYDGHQFIPATMLPLSLSYDHRVIDGAEAARFMVKLAEVLTDIRLNLL